MIWQTRVCAIGYLLLLSACASESDKRDASDATPEAGSEQPDAAMDEPDAETEEDASAGEDAGAQPPSSDASAEASVSAEYPGSDNTGPDLSQCPGGALEKAAGSGDYRAKSGELIRCKEFDDRAIYVAQDVADVTIEHCRFTTRSDRFINVQGARVTIQDSEFRGTAETWIRNSYQGGFLTVRRNDFSGMANAVEFNVGNETIEDNFIHDFGDVSADQHADGLQTNGTSHAVIRHNTVLLNPVEGATGAISVFETGDDILVERNKVAGGGYTVYPGGPKTTRIRFLNNCFSSVFYPGTAQSGAFGPWYPSNNPPELMRSGNTWCDGPRAGQPLDRNP